MQWLAISVVASVVLTVVLNLAIRAFPGAAEQIGQKVAELGERHPEGGVFFPWKAMIVASVVLTIGLNLLLWALR